MSSEQGRFAFKVEDDKIRFDAKDLAKMIVAVDADAPAIHAADVGGAESPENAGAVTEKKRGDLDCVVRQA